MLTCRVTMELFSELFGMEQLRCDDRVDVVSRGEGVTVVVAGVEPASGTKLGVEPSNQ